LVGCRFPAGCWFLAQWIALQADVRHLGFDFLGARLRRAKHRGPIFIKLLTLVSPLYILTKQGVALSSNSRTTAGADPLALAPCCCSCCWKLLLLLPLAAAAIAASEESSSEPEIICAWCKFDWPLQLIESQYL
jgi:hypothetical protein